MFKRRKKNNEAAEMGGSDSFLDVVSNIVGILLILVMIAGVRAQSSKEQRPVEPNVNEAATPNSEITQKEEEYAAAAEKLAPVQNHIGAMNVETELLTQNLELQSAEYAKYFDLLTSLRADIELKAEEKNLGVKEKIEQQRQLQDIDVKLAQIARTQEWIRQNRPKATVIENIPTPLSKSVGDSDKEIHFRLLGGNIVYVPFPELMEKLKGEVVQNQNRFKKSQLTEGRLGPMDDFYLDYLIGCYDAPVRDAYGMGIGKQIILEYAELQPANEAMGQSLQNTLKNPSSPIMQRLKNCRQDIYTITVWVYPDSYKEYRELRQLLYERGYKVAGRPMEHGKPISGSPRGSRSAAQ
jgi:hypothetical protein